MSGIRKFVRTPPISTAAPDSRGKPLTSTPTSVDVPPTSATIASRTPGQVRRAAQRVRRPAADRQHRVAERRSSSAISVPSFWAKNVARLAARARPAPPSAPATSRGDAAQRGVQHGRVLALEQAERADLVAQRDVHVVAQLLAHDPRPRQLVLGRDRGEHAGHARPPSTAPATRLQEPAERVGVERDDLAAVELDAAADDRLARRDDRRAGRRGHSNSGGTDVVDGRADAAHGHPVQAAALEHRVGGVRGAQHDVGDPARLDARRVDEHGVDRRGDARR